MQPNNFCSIDVGCTNIKMMAVIDNIPVYKTIPSGDNFTREELIYVITNFYNSFNVNFHGLGIAFSGCSTDFASVEYTTLPCLQDFSVSDLSELGCNNIYLLNDSNAAALAGTIEYPDASLLLSITIKISRLCRMRRCH